MTGISGWKPCMRCYGDVRGECIRCGFCIFSDEPNRLARLRYAWANDEGGWKTCIVLVVMFLLIALAAWSSQ